MDTTTLRTFIALAQIKNFTKTAQQLVVAQSTVTNRIRDLEMELGVPLFIRSHKQVDLTPSGQKFLDYAQRFVSLELAALQDIDRTILMMLADGSSEAATGKAVGLSQKAVNKRKHKLYALLKEHLEDFR